MNPEKQRIAIAEACGWSDVRKQWIGYGGGDYEDLLGVCPQSGDTVLVPDYLNDLNAMHEAEKVLNADQLNALDYNLDVIMDRVPRRFDRMSWHAHKQTATAAQRAEAFLRTIGKWEES